MANGGGPDDVPSLAVLRQMRDLRTLVACRGDRAVGGSSTGRTSHVPWAHAHIDAAQAHLQQRDLDGAVAALRPVLDLPPDGRNDPVVQHLGRLRQMLTLAAFASTPLAQSLQDEIETYGREALPRQITG